LRLGEKRGSAVMVVAQSRRTARFLTHINHKKSPQSQTRERSFGLMIKGYPFRIYVNQF